MIKFINFFDFEEREKIPYEIRNTRLTQEEKFDVEEVLVDAFLVADPQIANVVSDTYLKSRSLSDAKERIMTRKNTVSLVSSMISRKWDVDSDYMAELCTSRLWNLTDEERTIRESLERENNSRKYT